MSSTSTSRREEELMLAESKPSQEDFENEIRLRKYIAQKEDRLTTGILPSSEDGRGPGNHSVTVPN